LESNEDPYCDEYVPWAEEQVMGSVQRDADDICQIPEPIGMAQRNVKHRLRI
jgi:hypothetical protein